MEIYYISRNFMSGCLYKLHLKTISQSVAVPFLLAHCKKTTTVSYHIVYKTFHVTEEELSSNSGIVAPSTSPLNIFCFRLTLFPIFMEIVRIRLRYIVEVLTDFSSRNTAFSIVFTIACSLCVWKIRRKVIRDKVIQAFVYTVIFHFRCNLTGIYF